MKRMTPVLDDVTECVGKKIDIVPSTQHAKKASVFGEDRAKSQPN